MAKSYRSFLSRVVLTLGLLAMGGCLWAVGIEERCDLMLRNFRPYLTAQFNGSYFNGEHSGASDEKGVRTNADLSMIAAYIGEKDMALKSLRYSYSTHKANRLTKCTDGRYWGSVSDKDHVWESSLWAFSMAFSAYLQWDELTTDDIHYIYNVLKAECDYELERTIPTGFNGDTKAEENGWETNVLAAALGLFPDDSLADRWFGRLREFAINSYSHPEDQFDATVIDPDYDSRTVADLWVGANLYQDYTLQNHGYFHSSYQNVVMQELGESALALRLFQLKVIGKERWKTNALMHNNQKVMDKVLKWLALPDGELAMPNGNDWSLFLYDQVTSYSTMSCFLRDPDALMLEEACVSQIERRQHTTPDGSWLLRPDVGARRMGVEAHRVMMTSLMHKTMPTDGLQPTRWRDFVSEHRGAKYFSCQKVFRFLSDKLFFTFGWSDGLRDYTGYFTPLSADANNMMVPFRKYNTGNLIGWYNTKGHKVNAQPAGDPDFMLSDDKLLIKGRLRMNDGNIFLSFSIIVEPDEITYMDHVTTINKCTFTSSVETPLAISLDPFTKERRDIKISGSKATIDKTVRIDFNNGKIHQTEPSDNNSILTSVLHTTSFKREKTIDYEEPVKDHTINIRIL